MRRGKGTHDVTLVLSVPLKAISALLIYYFSLSIYRVEVFPLVMGLFYNQKNLNIQRFLPSRGFGVLGFWGFGVKKPER